LAGAEESEGLEITAAREATRRFFVVAIERGGGAKRVAQLLSSKGRSVKERTVASWREGRHFPDAVVTAMVAEITGESFDGHLRAVVATEEVQAEVARLDHDQGILIAWVLEAGEKLGLDFLGRGGEQLSRVPSRRRPA
jgi:hypothetical protein